MTELSPKQRIIAYYRTQESRWGYPLLLGGAKHFGYYPPGLTLSMRQSLRIMEEVLGRTVGLQPGARVLDAGCGMGRVGTYLAKNFGYRIEGIDLLDFNIEEAKRFTVRHGQQNRSHFQIGDYSQLPFPDNSFDAVYTMETLVHAPDFRVALAEFYRVLKPGGRLVNFEYTITQLNDMEPKARRAFTTVIEHTAMLALPEFVHNSFSAHLSAAGFTGPSVLDITDRTVPMWRRFSQLAYVPYVLLKHTGVHPSHYVNAISGVEWYRHIRHFRYNIATSHKPAD